MAVTRGFIGRRAAESSRVPPGQYVTRDFPVLSAGPTPYTPLDTWDFTIRGAVDNPVSWSWAEFQQLPHEKFTVDIHCVTKWTRLDMAWSGVPLDTFLDAVPTQATYALAFSDGGYTTNIPLADLRGGKAWIVDEYDGRPLEPEHGGPARLLCRICTSGRARNGSVAWSCGPQISRGSGRCSAITTMETRGKSSATTATDVADRHGDLDDLGDAAGEDHRP